MQKRKFGLILWQYSSFCAT